METFFTAPTMHCKWGETTSRALQLVQYRIASGVLCESPIDESKRMDPVDLRNAVATRMMRWADALTLRCLILDFSVEDMMDTEEIMRRAKSTRARLMAPGLTMEKLGMILQDVRDLEEHIMALMRKRGESRAAQDVETTS
jgi:hypothetical protein